MLFFIIAEIGYRAGQVFYNALLIDIADDDELGKVSETAGPSVRSAASSAGDRVAMIQMNPGNNLIIRLSLLVTAIFYAVFTIPAFFLIKETHRPQKRDGKSLFTVALDRLKTTIRSVKNYTEFLKFMLAVLIYNDGIIAALDFAAIIGTVVFGVTSTELVIFVIIIQITNVAGAFFYGNLGEKIGYKTSLIHSLILMIITVVGMLFVPSKLGYFIVGSIAGFAMAGVQSLDRTLVSVFAPAHRSAEFYGFFSPTGRTSSIIGPGVMGLAASGLSAWVMNSLVKANLVVVENELAHTVAEQIGTRLALITVLFFLIIGLMPLLFVNEEEGRKVAKNVAAE